MPLQFERYRMQDGRTRLGAAYFNPLLADLDLRIATLETLRLDWEAAVAELQAFGLTRIDATLGPMLDAITGQLAEQQATAAQLLADWEAASGANLQALADGVEAAEGAALALIDYREPDALALTRDGSDRLSTLAETLGEEERVTTLTYDVNGRLATAVSVDANKTRTETYSYDGNGLLTGFTAVEVAA